MHYQLQMFAAQTGGPPSVHTAASIFQKLCYENKDNLSAGIIVAGYVQLASFSRFWPPLRVTDPASTRLASRSTVRLDRWDAENGPSVYNIPLGGGLFRQPWAIGGSGSTYIYGYCDATFEEGWGEERTVKFVQDGQYIRTHPIFAAARQILVPVARRTSE